MSQVIKVPAELREVQGKGASRRLRREGLVPGVIYGGDRKPANIQIPQKFLLHALEDDAFYTSILEVEAGEKRQKAILRDLHRHPFKLQIMHIDLQRISDDEELRIFVPLHFVNEAKSPAGKKSGVVISHLTNELEILCLPKNLPEFIEVDLAELEVGGSIHLNEIVLPEGVSLVAHTEEELTATVVNAQHVQIQKVETEDADAEAESEGEGERDREEDRDDD